MPLDIKKKKFLNPDKKQGEHWVKGFKKKKSIQMRLGLMDMSSLLPTFDSNDNSEAVKY